MSNETQRVTVDLPMGVHRKLKILSAAQGRSMRDVFIEAIEFLEKKTTIDTKISNLNHQAYKLRYDSYEDKK